MQSEQVHALDLRKIRTSEFRKHNNEDFGYTVCEASTQMGRSPHNVRIMAEWSFVLHKASLPQHDTTSSC
jgi:hypothetical protein